MTNIAINGIGRIGKLALKILVSNNFDVKYINELNGNSSNLLHSLEFDSVHGKWAADFKANDNSININEKVINTTFYNKIEDMDLNEIDIVIDCTGVNNNKTALKKYFDKGTKKVIVSAPIYEENIANIAYGVNQQTYIPSKNNIITAASCTTNCIAPIIKVLHEKIGINHGSITTIHNITNSQTLVDLPQNNLRRARSAINNLIPTTTGSAKAISLIYPELKGKLNGHAIRVPLLNASLTDCVFEMNNPVNENQINALLRNASENELKGILGYEDRALVSTDFVNDPRSSIIDALSTMVVNKTQLKLYAWYDNEWGYANRLVDIVSMVSNTI
ncbi:ArsJ-associated glyceraldehyde-3-phosphate dehydrogenase [Alphaproteobacteria bacterium]|nr:ArsJ-associated glyceraldehyde-3-phosphate dehydrogenase [Alphaproteobacteria bacterium]